MELKDYAPDYGRAISVPRDWMMERKEQGSYIFYADDPEDETTIYALAFHAEHRGSFAPECAMKETFERTIPNGAQEVEIMTSLHCKAFFLHNPDGTYRIGAGFFTDGDLLSINVYAKNEDTARLVSAGLSKVTFNRGGENGF